MKPLVAALAILPISACATAQVEEPAFSLVRADDNFEIRDYAPTITADVTVRGEPVAARNRGFMPLADYIFAKEREGEKIAMTAPVTQRPPREKIAMTAPVAQQPSADGWTVSFTMPAEYTMETLPPPANPDVRLVQHPPRRVAVLKFSGLAGEDRMDEKRRELMQAVAAAGLKPSGEPEFAFYDPPWTLPFMRRNEVMVELAPG